MRTIFAEYNPGRNSIDVYTSAGYMLRIDCWEAEKNLKTTNALIIGVIYLLKQIKKLRKYEANFRDAMEELYLNN